MNEEKALEIYLEQCEEENYKNEQALEEYKYECAEIDYLREQLQAYKEKEERLRALVEQYKDEYVPNDYILQILNKED